MKIFKVSSSQGFLIVNEETGVVIECNSNRSKNDYLFEIERFHVVRYKAAFKSSTIPEYVDILRLAYWAKNNIYETPAAGYEPIFI